MVTLYVSLSPFFVRPWDIPGYLGDISGYLKIFSHEIFSVLKYLNYMGSFKLDLIYWIFLYATFKSFRFYYLSTPDWRECRPCDWCNTDWVEKFRDLNIRINIIIIIMTVWWRYWHNIKLYIRLGSPADPNLFICYRMLFIFIFPLPSLPQHSNMFRTDLYTERR